MLRKWLVGMFLVLISSLIYAQNSGIKGKILDSNENTPLIGATISSNDLGVVSDIEGGFNLALQPGTYELTVSYIGFNSVTQTIEIVENEWLNMDFALITSAHILEEATVTGSKHEKSIGRSPVSLTILKPRLADNTNTTRISTLLDKIPGVQIIDNQANIRGGSGWSYGAGSRVLLLIDDIPALQADAGRPSWGDIPVENISQVEVLKGASSTLYGSSALNGIVNIRTGYATSTPVTKANVGYSTYDSPKDKNKQWWTTAPSKLNIGLLHKQKIGKLDVVANAYYENFESYYEEAFEEKKRASANLKYRVNDKITIGLNTMFNFGDAADYFIWKNGGPGVYKGLDGTFSVRNYQRYYFDPQITIFGNNDSRHKILGRHYSIDNNNNNGQANSSKTNYFEYQYLKSVNNWDLDITAGAVGQLIKSDSELLQDSTVTHNNFAQYVEFDKKIGSKFTATLGFRHEYHEQNSEEIEGGKDSESKIISRFGINYEVAKGTYLRSSWGQGYRYPTIVERFITTAVGGFFIFPNAELTSEFGWSSEFGVKQGFLFGGLKGYLDLSVFWSRYNDMTEFTLQQDELGNFGFQSQNVGKTDIKGYEIEFVSVFNIQNAEINVITGYTFINPKYQDFENNATIFNSISVPIGETEKQNILKYRNKHNFKIDIEANVDNFSFGGAVNLVSETKTIDNLLGTVGQIRLYRMANPGGFVKLDGRISYKLSFAKLSLLAENILNEEYTLRPGLLEAPRNFGFRLDFNLQ